MPPALRRLPRRETGRRPSPQPPHPRLRRPTGGGELGAAAMQGCGPGRPRAVGMGWGWGAAPGATLSRPLRGGNKRRRGSCHPAREPVPPPWVTMPQPLPRAGDAPRLPTGTGVCPALPARGARGCSREASCWRPAEPWLAAASGTFHLPSSCQVLTGLPLRGSAKWASHSDAVPGGPSPEGSKVQTSPTGRACGERACAAA